MEIKKTDLVRLEVQEINLVPLKKMIEQIALAQGRPKWCDGILLYFVGYNMNEKLIEEMTQGIYKWQTLDFAIMEKYERILKDDFNNEFVCYDVSTSQFYQEITNYLKKQLPKN